MASFLFRAAEQALQREYLAWTLGDSFVRMSVKRRTWRTLWLVPRTYRVKVPTVRVSLHTSPYSEGDVVGRGEGV